MIYVVDDYFVEHLNGGAERNTAALLSYLPINHIKIRSANLRTINEDDFYLIGNFQYLNNNIKKQLQEYGNYIIFEKDFKILKIRNPHYSDERYPNYPSYMLHNIDFYNNAKKVICLTDLQAQVFKNNLKENQVEVIHGTIFSEEDLQLIEKNIYVKKQDCAFIPNATNKGATYNIHFCKEKKWCYNTYWGLPYSELISTLAKHTKLVFFPPVMESCSRLVIEARMLGLDIYTHDMIGAIHEWWYKHKGYRLVDDFRYYIIPNAIKLFMDLLPLSESDIYNILSKIKLLAHTSRGLTHIPYTERDENKFPNLKAYNEWVVYHNAYVLGFTPEPSSFEEIFNKYNNNQEQKFCFFYTGYFPPGLEALQMWTEAYNNSLKQNTKSTPFEVFYNMCIDNRVHEFNDYVKIDI